MEQSLRGVNNHPQFVVATPHRSVCDDNARALDQAGHLRFIALGTRRGTKGISPERTRLNPRIGLCAYAAARTLSPFRAESLRFRLLPWFDRWVLKQLQPGDHIISSYGYTNACFQFVRRHGGRTFVDAGNSHIENFWEILTEEHSRWNCPYPAIPRFWYERAKEMLAGPVDFVLSPSSYVTKSFLDRGYKPEQIIRNVYPVDLSTFRAPECPRPKNRPLTVINTGSLSLRKGTPYLLEAFRILRQRHPSARLLLTQIVQDDVKEVLRRYTDLPIEWAPALPHSELAARLRTADVFVLPSLEDGWARTVCEALACGLQVVVTPHTGACDVVERGITGEVVPIRDPLSIVEAILTCWDRSKADPRFNSPEIGRKLSFETFAAEFIEQLKNVGLA